MVRQNLSFHYSDGRKDDSLQHSMETMVCFLNGVTYHAEGVFESNFYVQPKNGSPVEYQCRW